MHGIDCLEKGQAFGNKAKHVVSAFMFRKEATLQTYGTDKYGRTIADVFLHDGTKVNHELVKNGWCWWYRKYAPKDTELERLEREAREAKKGLWANPAPVPPWEWRKEKRRSTQALTRLYHQVGRTTTSTDFLLSTAYSIKS